MAFGIDCDNDSTMRDQFPSVILQLIVEIISRALGLIKDIIQPIVILSPTCDPHVLNNCVEIGYDNQSVSAVTTFWIDINANDKIPVLKRPSR